MLHSLKYSKTSIEKSCGRLEFSLPPYSQGNCFSGGPGMYQVWTGLVFKNPDPLCDPLAALFGKISIILPVKY